MRLEEIDEEIADQLRQKEEEVEEEEEEEEEDEEEKENNVEYENDLLKMENVELRFFFCFVFFERDIMILDLQKLE